MVSPIQKKWIYSKLTIFIIFLSSLSLVFINVYDNQNSSVSVERNTPEINPYENNNYLDVIADSIAPGGVVKDGIPALNLPLYINLSEANKILKDSDIIFGLNFEGQVLAFPQRIMVHHEIVNTKGNETKISITYCPLTGSAIGFKAHIGSKQTTFGVSGKLVNSNLVMYDRLSGSYWPQIIGQSVMGPSKGIQLEKIQLFWTNWGLWKLSYPNTLVLSENTGHIRNYHFDPYGSYESESSYYNSGFPVFSTLYYDLILSDKTVVIGIQQNNSQLAIEKEFLRQEKVINTVIANQSIVIFYDETLDVARVYHSQINDQKFNFTWSQGVFFDEKTQSEWTINGSSKFGSLIPIVYLDVMWFAWVSFFPDTTLIKL